MSSDILGERIKSANKKLAEEKAQYGDKRIEQVAHFSTVIQILETFQTSGIGFESEEKLEEELKKVLFERKKELRKQKDAEKKAGKAAKIDAQIKKAEEEEKSISVEEREKREKEEREAYERAEELAKEEERKRKQDEHEELKRNAKELMSKADNLFKKLNEQNVPHTDYRWVEYLKLSEKASIVSAECEELKPVQVVDPQEAKKQHVIFQMESRSLQYNLILTSYRSFFRSFEYSKLVELDEDADDYYEKLTESYSRKIEDLKRLKEKLVQIMTDSEIFKKQDFLFDFDDGKAIPLIIDKLIKRVSLMKKIDELDEKLTAAGLDECEEYSEEEYQKKLKELQTV